jgi:hypothetical protein
MLALAVTGLCAVIIAAEPVHSQGMPANAGLQSPHRGAPNANATANACNRAANPGKRYFIEFRARMAQSYGHAFVVFGKLNERGEIVQSQIAGLHPVGDSVTYVIGHVIPVPAETGASVGDSDEIYVSARYCVLLSEPQYKRTVAFIRQEQASSKLWHAVAQNCVGFIRDIASFLKLQLPASQLLYAEVWVKNLSELNSASQHGLTMLPYAQWGISPPK